ncbi:MAG TPA: cupin domain-containing protein [Chloroflexota bacterium]
MDSQSIITALGLVPHPEGGYFAETYRADELLPPEALSRGYPDARSVSTAIYYLLTPDTFSELHSLRSDEIFHFYLGDPVEMLQLWPDGSGEVVTLGTDIAAGMRPQVVVPGSVWQGSRLVPGGSFALLGCTVAPGFDYSDYEAGKRDDLLYLFPRFEEMIKALTRG